MVYVLGNMGHSTLWVTILLAYKAMDRGFDGFGGGSLSSVSMVKERVVKLCRVNGEPNIKSWVVPRWNTS